MAYKLNVFKIIVAYSRGLNFCTSRERKNSWSFLASRVGSSDQERAR